MSTIKLNEGPLIHIYEWDKLLSMFSKNEPYELKERSFFSSYLKKGNIVFDIGANFGLYSLIASPLVGNEGSIHSFEPAPEEYKRLEENVKLNNFTNIIMNNFALSNIVGETNLNVFDNGYGAWNSLNPGDMSYLPKHVGASKIRVKETTLDLYARFLDIKNINLIKIDVEGSELNVLQGAVETIKKFTIDNV